MASNLEDLEGHDVQKKEEDEDEQELELEPGPKSALPVTSPPDEPLADTQKGMKTASVLAPAEPPSEQQQVTQIDTEDYSIFSVGQKRAMVFGASFAAWFSPMTGSIYYPALNQIAADLHVSNAKVALTITTYLIIQGIAPTFVAQFSDGAGRKPAYFFCFVIYIIANIALGLQNNWLALLLLRMLQSAGSSGTVSLSNGLVGDIITSADRGKYIAFASVGAVLGPSLSPVLGGVLSQYLGWHWIFWFLLILSAVYFVPLALFLPETCRKIVGDGSIPPPWSSWNVSDYVRFRRRARKGIPIDQEKLRTLRKNYKLGFPNPLKTLVILTELESTLLLFGSGTALACFYAIATGAAGAFSELYGFDAFQISLIFLPIGAGGIISAFTTGILVDWNYRRHAKRLNFPIQKNRQTDLSDFPIELARMQIAVPMFFLGSAGIVGYGWMLTHKLSLAGPIIMLFLLGYCLIVGAQTMSVLIIDIHPGRPATATAANNFVRCLLGAAASAAIEPMVRAIGNGWAYTILAGIFFIGSFGPIASMRYGIKWRRAQKEKVERREKARQAKAEEKVAREEGRNRPDTEETEKSLEGEASKKEMQ